MWQFNKVKRFLLWSLRSALEAVVVRHLSELYETERRRRKVWESQTKRKENISALQTWSVLDFCKRGRETFIHTHTHTHTHTQVWWITLIMAAVLQSCSSACRLTGTSSVLLLPPVLLCCDQSEYAVKKVSYHWSHFIHTLLCFFYLWVLLLSLFKSVIFFWLNSLSVSVKMRSDWRQSRV